jgi:hypothetical protein
MPAFRAAPTTNPAAPTFGVVTSIESARVARIGAQFSF